jgi:diguanylate cyclase (GGDEF)-like protein
MHFFTGVGFNYLILVLFLGITTSVQAISFTEEEQAYLANKSSISMCIDPDWMPFEAIDENGQHIGLSADYMAEYSKMIGVKIELVKTSTWSESLLKAQARECDIVAMLNSSPERSKYLNFTKPYVTAAVALISRSDVLFIDGLSALEGKTLAMPKSYIYEELIKRDYPGINVIYTSNQQESIKLVSTGRAYASIGTQITLLRDIQLLATQNVKVAGFTEYKSILRVGIRNDDPVLISVFSKAVDELPAARANEMLQSWYSVTVENKIDFTLLWSILAFFAVVLFAFFMRLRSVRRFNEILSEKNVQLERLSQTDHLTGLYNRLKTDEVIKSEIARADRYGGSFSVMIFDIDFFKQINDTKGHQVGDRVLIQISRLVANNLREPDVLGRWGGEEFMIVSPELDAAEAALLAEKLRALVEDYVFPEQIKVTASFGVAEYHMGDSPNVLLSRADKLLYEAKSAGRNLVKVG